MRAMVWECRVPATHPMKFRFVFLGPDDDANESIPASEPSVKMPGGKSGRARYEQTAVGMVRVEHLKSGRSRVVELTNFGARIVGDVILDDGDEERREFRLEVDLAGQTLCFSGIPRKEAQ